jgi:hypothetical protein
VRICYLVQNLGSHNLLLLHVVFAVKCVDSSARSRVVVGYGYVVPLPDVVLVATCVDDCARILILVLILNLSLVLSWRC